LQYVKESSVVATFLTEPEVGSDADWAFELKEKRFGGGNWGGVGSDHVGIVAASFEGDCD
jgi:hypothetical protein